MKYENAIEVLPKKLVEEIQKYTSGTLLYIPDNKETKTWGQVSGYRAYLTKRNQMIKNRFKYGESINQLSDRYFLSKETIKKLVYSKRQDKLTDFYPTIASAMEYEEEGLLEEWIHTYLLFERKNKAFSDGLYQTQRYYVGPISMPLSYFNRNSGPESHMKWIVHPEVFEERVKQWMNKLEVGEAVPPLIINYEKGSFEVNCNNPLLEALNRMNQKSHPIILWISTKEDYEEFQEKHKEIIGNS